VDWDISPKFGLQIEFDLPIWAKSRKTKPEVELRCRGHHQIFAGVDAIWMKFDSLRLLDRALKMPKPPLKCSQNSIYLSKHTTPYKDDSSKVAQLKQQITKDDINCTAYRQRVTVLRSNIILCDICCFSCATWLQTYDVVNC